MPPFGRKCKHSTQIIMYDRKEFGPMVQWVRTLGRKDHSLAKWYHSSGICQVWFLPWRYQFDTTYGPLHRLILQVYLCYWRLPLIVAFQRNTKHQLGIHCRLIISWNYTEHGANYTPTVILNTLFFLLVASTSSSFCYHPQHPLSYAISINIFFPAIIFDVIFLLPSSPISSFSFIFHLSTRSHPQHL